MDGIGVDHRGSHIAVAKYLLNLADVVVRLQQTRCNRVPKCVRRDPFTYSLMDYLAERGFDVFTVEYQNYGRSAEHECGSASRHKWRPTTSMPRWITSETCGVCSKSILSDGRGGR